jgi:hypothetical protein
VIFIGKLLKLKGFKGCPFPQFLPKIIKTIKTPFYAASLFFKEVGSKRESD